MRMRSVAASIPEQGHNKHSKETSNLLTSKSKLEKPLNRTAGSSRSWTDCLMLMWSEIEHEILLDYSSMHKMVVREERLFKVVLDGGEKSSKTLRQSYNY